MIGAKSVPALPKKYSTPRAARSSRYASAVVSMSAFLLMSAPAVSLQPKSQHPPRVPLVDLRFFGGRSPHPLHRHDRVPDEPRPLLGVEGHIRPEQYPLGPEERQSAFHGVLCAEEGSVAVEHLEIVERPPAEARQGDRVVRVLGAAAELVEPAARAALEVRQHRAHVVRDDREVRVTVEEPREDQTRHRGGRLVGPAERPPDVVARPLLPGVVGEDRGPRRVEPDRQPARRHTVEERRPLGLVERPPVDVGEDLDAGGAEPVDGAVDLSQGGVGVVHRQGGDEAGEAVGMLRDQLGHAVVREARQRRGRVRAGERLDRRRREREDLDVTLVPVHDPEALLEERFRIMDRYEGYVQVLTLASPPIEALAGPDAAPALARLANDGMAELVAKHPDRFPGFVASLPMNNPDAALREIDRAIDGLGATGVQIFSNVNGRPLDEPEWAPLFDRLAARRLPIWLHPARPAVFADYPGEKRSRYDIWWAFGWPYETTAAIARR